LLAISIWNYVESKKEFNHFFYLQAKLLIQKDIDFRKWNASHAGVYVPITKASKPNPYLKDFPERDIETKTGKKLTLVNSDYMVRQVNQKKSS